ncbi:MAG: hydroxymethylglutaryl-CoA lyase [Bacteroidia bacterium]|nr:hydroxymethylglutaryl-CoA lyase [Bacteroidia bacterium]MBP6648227.1 hydroxymethylglutaryl-CoA lyase [Bacteroidia bacterium]
MSEIKLVECPRDAMQGWEEFIPTGQKIRYLNSLLKVGFHTLDFGSFVSPKAIPQLRDTEEVLAGLELSSTKTKLLAIVANVRGAEQALNHDEISFLGFPFSVSEEFQKRNTNSTIEESLMRVEEIQKLCIKKNKDLVIYISMGFGNPYGEPWNAEIVIKWVRRLSAMGIKIIALSDTVGVSNPVNISSLFTQLIPEVKEVEFGAHLHSNPLTWLEKVEAAYQSGCKRFDSALKGIGGCPMANDDLVGNLATENLVSYFKGIQDLQLQDAAFRDSLAIAAEIFH